jgi:hypothetical protein
VEISLGWLIRALGLIHRCVQNSSAPWTYKACTVNLTTDACVQVPGMSRYRKLEIRMDGYRVYQASEPIRARPLNFNHQSEQMVR